ncbi:MAG: PKD domain-containing protein [Cyclobacteriaceae bacterium]|nr:PKD domain-containing protein [Cyclobacteriaceae bacterium]
MKISLNNAKLITAALVITTLSGFFAMVTFLTGCIDDTEKLPKVVAVFTYTVNEDTGTVQFFNVSERATKYLWSFGDNTTSTEKDPVKTYAAGTYEVTLKASNNAGASNEAKATVTVVIKDKVSLPITFDGINVDYEVTTFNGASFAIVNNPSESGTNTKVTKVGSITNSGTQFEGMFLNVAVPIDLATKKTIALNVRSTKPVNVLLKLEEGTSGPVEVSASHGGTGWENLVFNFTSAAKYSRITLFIGGATATTGTFFVDDIEQKVTETPCTPETVQSITTADFNITFKTDPGTAIGSFDAVYTYANNPNINNAVNTSCKVGKIERSGGALFANNQIELSSKLDFNTHSGFKLKVFSAATGYSVLVKLEDKLNTNLNTEVSKTTTVGTNQWEELTFPFAGSQSGKYDRIILFFQLNTNTTATYYIDDFAYYGTGSGGPVCTPEATENINPANGDINWTFKTSDAAHTFEAFGNTAGAIVANPVVGGINTSCNVEKFTKTNGCETWSGLGTTLATALDFGVITKKVFKMKVLAQTQATAVTLRLEKLPFPDTEPSQDRVANVTQVGVWQELTFDFSDVTTGTFKSMIIYFERNANCDGDIYYFDDITQVAGSAPVCTPEATENINPANGDMNWTFKTNSVANTFEAFGNTAGAIVANPVLGGINNSCNVEKFTKTNGCETWSGLGTTLATALDFGVITKKVFKMKVLAQTQTTAVTLRLEKLPFPDTEPSQDRVANITQVGVWQELTFDFSDLTTGTFKSMIIYFERNANCDGDVYYFDDITQVAGSGGGGGSTNLITNGGFESGDTGWLLFNNNGATSISSTENNGGTKSAKIESGKFDNPGIKQERFAVGTVLANTQYEVKFDVKQQALADGAIVNAFVFSETSNANPAVQHQLTPITLSQGNWSSNTLTFTTAADVSGGISLLIEVVCGGADTCNGVVYIDNVSITKK